MRLIKIKAKEKLPKSDTDKRLVRSFVDKTKVRNVNN
jgi:hypothetical protein